MNRTFSSEKFWIFDTHKYTNERRGGGRLSMAFPYNPCDWYIYIIYLPTWMVDFYGKLVGKYTIRGFYDFCIRFKQKTCCTNKIPRLYHMDPWYCYRNSSRYIITHLNIWLHLIPLKKVPLCQQKRAGEFDMVSFTVSIGVRESSGKKKYLDITHSTFGTRKMRIHHPSSSAASSSSSPSPLIIITTMFFSIILLAMFSS